MSIGHFAFANNSNRFLAAPELTDQPFAITGVPFDGAVTNRPGARFGPQEIRRASLMLCDGLHPLFEVSPLGLLGDAGDMRLPNASPLAQVRSAIQKQAAVLMARHHCVFRDRFCHVPHSMFLATHDNASCSQAAIEPTAPWEKRFARSPT